jgi:type I restriction enzyme M protein
VTNAACPPLTLREGYTLDFIDGTPRKKTAEEYVRQNVERSLVQEYRYPTEDIAVEFSVKMGRQRKRADIVIFNEGAAHLQENVLLICECKSEEVPSQDKKEGVEQLKSYMTACLNCRFGLWTNGSDERICFRKDDDGKVVEYNDIIDIPVKGEDVKDSDVPTRLLLKAATGDNLLLAFKRCHNYIAGNQGIQKQETFTELLKVIFCKIEDERTLDNLRF